MASLRELKKRLLSIKSTGKLAGAMRTVATAKYGRVNSQRETCAPYAAALNKLGEDASAASQAKKADDGETEFDPAGKRKKPLYVLISSNRGLCGGYNHELFNFFAENVPVKGDCLLVVCGRMAREYCREKGIEPLAVFDIPDLPSFEVSRGLAEFICGEYETGEAESVSFVCQEFKNMLDCAPAVIPFLPAPGGEEEEPRAERDMLFIPDAETVLRQIVPAGRAFAVHQRLISCAAGAAAATLIAMRTAYDSSREQAAALETAINRRRQAEITGSVIETASDLTRQQ